MIAFAAMRTPRSAFGLVMPVARTIVALRLARAAVSMWVLGSVLGALLAPACHGGGPPAPAPEPGTTHATPPAAAEHVRPAPAAGAATGAASGSTNAAATGPASGTAA